MGRLRRGRFQRSSSSRSSTNTRGSARRTPQSSRQPRTLRTQSGQTSQPSQPSRTTQSSQSSQSSTKPQADSRTADSSSSKPAETPKDEAGAKNKASGLLGNMFSSEGLKTLTGATKSFEFDDKERKRAEAGLSALKKMAGEDGVLTPSDRENIIGQMDGALTAEKNRTVAKIADQKIQQAKNERGPLRKALFPRAPLVSKVGAKKKAEAMRDPQHMNTARQTALGQLNQGFKDMGMDTNAAVSLPRGLQASGEMPSISLDDTNAFKDTMQMVQQKAKEMGLPEGKFEKGLPVGFLEDVLAGKRAYSLRKHQVNPYGK